MVPILPPKEISIPLVKFLIVFDLNKNPGRSELKSIDFIGK